MPQSPSSSSGIGILDFLQGNNYFITGATGFVSKVLVEKMLRIVPKVRRIFLLIKENDKDVAMERLKFFKSMVTFMMSKPVPVHGNVCEYNLVMDFDTIIEIARHVHLIKCKNLKLFLHVSIGKEEIILERLGKRLTEERIPLEASIPWLDVSVKMKLASDMMASLWNDIKGMLINRKREKLPVVIIHPSSIESTSSEQIDLVFISYGKDQLPGFIGNPKIVLDIIPVGIVVNAIMEVMAKHGIVAKAQLHVYRITSSVFNPISFGQLFDFACDQLQRFTHMVELYKPYKLFRFDVEIINWKYYIKNVHLLGIRRHIIKEKLAAVASL
ncbi:hypothetical protein P3X46_032289 [Hevea brasiliensis]|uniref:Fatty acyl-CoA reductase n=1 Tax=Hevea brasiliensis TaxID=3981 RepID=A0ABQ9KEB2_HEVBR|nr:hypothetical protein P3X46_032289 [Hevea brasiliensis]